MVNTPLLMQGMTGVYWDNGNEVIVTEENQENWYNYSEQRWANAKTKDGSYWVWIPRYEYKINEDKTINVKFIPVTQTTVDSEYTYIHPAFVDGTNSQFKNGEWDKEIAGFWVAKYAAGFQASTISTSDATTAINASDTIVYSDKNYTLYADNYTTNALGQDLTESKYATQKISYPVFKPLTYAYNVISIGDSYTISQEITKESNFYGLNASITDSHMLKNSEYGAIIYLMQSKYGRDGEEISINNYYTTISSPYKTAVTGVYSDGTSTIKTNSIENVYAYNTQIGQKGSSTGNITGVYDLNGCIFERVSAYITNGSVLLSNAATSFAKVEKNLEGYQTLSTKYVTVYPFSSLSDTAENNWNIYNELKSLSYGYGDAILEVSTAGSGLNSWNNKYSHYTYSDRCFFYRGGRFDAGNSAGTFGFHAAGRRF